MNMNLYNREQQDKYLKNRIEELKAAANLAPAIIKVFEDFDNKVFNIKLSRALYETTGKYIRCEKRYQSLEVYYYEHDHYYILANIKIDELIDGKRIPANLFIQSARDHQQKALKTAADIQKAIDNIDYTIDQINQLKKAIKGVINDIPYEVLDVYRLEKYRY